MSGAAEPGLVNVSHRLRRHALDAPGRIAVRAPGRGGGWDEIDFAALDRTSDAIAHGLARLGLARGERASIFLRPGALLVATSYALWKLGAVPVLIDPGMGRSALARCIAQAAPRFLIGVPLAQAFRVLHARSFAATETAITAGRGWPFGETLERLAERHAAQGAFAIADTRADEPAAILFTSGSTGPAKGVVHTHGMLDAAASALVHLYGFAPGEVDVACFPLFGLFDVALGLTAVFPRLDPSRPGRCDPAEIVRAIEESRATATFGSPAIWRRVAPWCAARGKRLASLRRILVAGAPVPPSLVERCRAILGPDGDVHTPYGATEALPVTSIDGATITGELRGLVEGGSGTCIGRPVGGVDLELIAIQDEPIPDWSRVRAVRDGELGEICVRGPLVTRAYLDPAATAAAKIADGASVWHRMGDVGYRDAAGRVWFCGRKSHRIETARGLVMPVPAENVFDLHPAVARTALVGVGPRGSERPVLVVEPEAGRTPRGPRARERLAAELREIARARNLPAVERVLVHRRLPVDVRHNAKIAREELKRWAEAKG